MAERADGGRWRKIALVTVPAIVLAGSASGWLSNAGYGNPWFAALLKPPFMPPARTFPVAWTALYTLMAVSVAMVLAEPLGTLRRLGLSLFFVQLALNLAWSPIFFAGRDIRLASALLIVMLVVAVAAAAVFRRIRPVAGWLLLPYLLWLCFAWALNSSIDRLNPGAGSSLIG